MNIVVYTNIKRDGVGGGTDIKAAQAVADLGFEVIASGAFIPLSMFGQSGQPD